MWQTYYFLGIIFSTWNRDGHIVGIPESTFELADSKKLLENKCKAVYN